MNHEAVLKAAFFMCRALGQEPSRRNIAEVIRKQTGKAYRAAEICRFLRTFGTPASPNGNHLGTTPEPRREPPPEHELPLSGTTEGTTREPVTRAKKRYLLQETTRCSEPSVPHNRADAAAQLRLVRTPTDPVVVKAREYAAPLYAAYEAALAARGRKAESKAWFWNHNHLALKELGRLYALDAVLRAWKAECRSSGEVVYSMARVFSALRNGRASPAAAPLPAIPVAADLL